VLGLLARHLFLHDPLEYSSVLLGPGHKTQPIATSSSGERPATSESKTYQVLASVQVTFVYLIHMMRPLLLGAAALLVTCSSLRLITDMSTKFHGGCHIDDLVHIGFLEQSPESIPNATSQGFSMSQEQPAQCQNMLSRYQYKYSDSKPVIVAVSWIRKHEDPCPSTKNNRF
jgi:hypothetical protein